MSWYRRELPIIIVAAISTLFIVEYFFSVPASVTSVVTELKFWGTILSAFAFFLGVIITVRVQIHHVTRRTPDKWYMSLWTLTVAVIGTAIGLIYGQNHANFQWLYSNIIMPLWLAMTSTTGFFISSAAYRAFRARTVEASFLLLSGCLVILRNAPLFVSFWGGFTGVGNWIMDVVASGAVRGITIGVAIGSIAIGIRTILGYETGYLGALREESG
jgi:hypothetical protein